MLKITFVRCDFFLFWSCRNKRDTFNGYQSDLKIKRSHIKHQYFVVTSSCINKLVEHIYFVDMNKIKELCIVLKEITAAFVGVWQNITFLVFFFGLWKAIFFIIQFLNLLCDVYSQEKLNFVPCFQKHACSKLNT